MLRAILYAFFRGFFALLTRLRVEGLEHVPDTGGVILAANHMSILDAPLVFSILKRSDITGLVGDSYQRNPVIRPIVNAVGGIWINRDAADLAALRAARDYLRAGHGLGIAPEGTRSRIGALIPAKTGVAYLADKAGVPIVPVAIEGSEKVTAGILRLRRPRLVVRFGAPFSLPPVNRASREADLERNTDFIMGAIAGLLPERYHGAYAGKAWTGDPPWAGTAPEPLGVKDITAETG